VKFLVDECLHTSLVAVAEARGHEARHVNWLGLSGETDWGLMPRILDEDFTFVTNNARDFRKLYAREELHAGLLIIVPQVAPNKQRELFDALLEELGADAGMMNEIIEIALEDGAAIITRYELPNADAGDAESGS
jgi:predicted nuclease of predicted toxin-antitoxin system